MKRFSVFALFLSLGSLLAVAQQQPPLTNEGLIKMVQAGFDEGTILELIRANGSVVDTSVENLVALKDAGVSQNIIRELLGTGTETQGGNETPGEPEEIGVYVRKEGKLVMVEPEIVTWRTGGVLKSIATAGLTRGHVNGRVSDPHSRLQLSVPLEFVIVCPEGTSAAEYQLLQLQEKGNRREFRAVTGGIVHASGGAEKNAVDFEFERVRSRTYRIRIGDLKDGEYGFLAPGAAMSANASSLGKIYTFGLE